MRPIVAIVGPLLAGNATNIALSQTPTAGNLTLNGSTVVNGVAVLDQQRQVLITTAAGSEAGKNFVIVGTDGAGSPISETVAGPIANSTAGSVLSYATVSQITISGNATGNLSVGTSGNASSPWVRLDDWAPPQTSIQVDVATAGNLAGNYTVQTTLDDPNSPTNPVSPANVTWFNTALVGNTSSLQTSLTVPATYVRCFLNSGNATVSMTVLQSGVVPY